MAYVFDRTMAELQRDRDRPFGASVSKGAGAEVRDVQAGGGGSGAVGQQGQQSSMGGAAAQDQNALRRMVDANADTKLANPYEGINKQLRGAEKSLNKEANRYLGDVEDIDYTFSDKTLNRAIAGKDKYYNKVATQMASTAPSQLYPGFDPQTDVDVDQDRYLQAGGGTNYFADTGGGGQAYSLGERALDQTIIDRDPSANLTREAARRRQDNLLSRKWAIGDEFTGKAQERDLERFKEGQAANKARLSELGADIIAANEAEAAAANLAAGQEMSNADYASGEFANIMPLVMPTASGARGKVVGDVASKIAMGFDPTKFVSGGVRNDYKGSDFIDEKEAARLNRIAGLTGSGDIAVAGGGLSSRAFDSAAATEAARQQLKEGLAAADAGFQSEIDKILAENASEAARANKRLDPTTARNIAREKIIRWANQNGISLEGVDISDIENYITFAGEEATAQDMLDAIEVQKLNELMEKMGQEGTYAVSDQAWTPFDYDLERHGNEIRNIISMRNMTTSPDNPESPATVIGAGQGTETGPAAIDQGTTDYGAYGEGPIRPATQREQDTVGASAAQFAGSEDESKNVILPGGSAITGDGSGFVGSGDEEYFIDPWKLLAGKKGPTIQTQNIFNALGIY
jgi:hypothetical protein